MKKIRLYSTGCPRCNILKSKLDEHGVGYDMCNDIEEMQRLGIMSAPYLSVDGELFDYANSILKLKEIIL